MLLDQTSVGSKADEFSAENCPIAESNVSSLKSSVCEKSPHMSDTSSIHCVNSSHESLSDNVLGRGTFSNKYEDSKCAEGLDENTSCISESIQANIANDSNERNAEGISVSHSSDLRSLVASDMFRSAPDFEKRNFFDIRSSNDADAGNRSPKEKVSECPMNNTKSTLPAEAASTLVSDEPVKNPVQNEVDGKSKDLVELSVACKPPSSSLSEDESDESDIVEHDVKVCDICGDAGREAELAICSRCSDGAEHIYCMRDMLKKLPEGDWSCEECKAEETKNKKQDVEAKVIDSPHFSGKRHAQSTEVSPDSKRQALESSSGSPMASSSVKTGQLSRESSLKSTERGKLKPGNEISSHDHSRDVDVGMVRSPATFQRGLGPKGPLAKSYSFNTFNSKPKVKLVDEVPSRQKGAREHIFKDVKERPGKLLSKSMSFKSVNSSRSNATESKVKMLSPKITHSQDQKGLKQAKERSAFDRNKVEHPGGMTSPTVSTPKIDPKLIPQVESNSKDSKVAQDGKLGTVSTPRVDHKLVPQVESNNNDSRVAQDGKLSTLSKTSSSVARKGDSSVGAVSSGLPCASVSEKKLNHSNARDDPLPCFPSSSSEKTSVSIDKNPQDGLLSPSESKILVDKIRDTSLTSYPQAGAQKCEEVSHATDFCTSGSAQEGGSDVSASRSSPEIVHKGNKLKAAIHAALLRRPEIYKKKITDELSTSNSDNNLEIAQHLLVPNESKNSISAEEILEGGSAVENSASGSFECSATVKQLSVCTGDAHPSKPGNSDLHDSSSRKPAVNNLHYQSSVNVPFTVEMSTIPEYEYIWQGLFEVLRSGKPPDICGGMQAHLSTCASPRVSEVANRFPQRINLTELPRRSAWPSQFHQTGAREDNIALYFFAKDIESYEKYYKSLLDRMIKNDLALKGNFEGVELLIFPSTQLPEKSQRWNMLFFLWGVFRGKRTDASECLGKSSIPTILSRPQMDLPSAEPHCSQKRKEEFIACDQTCKVVVTSNAPDLMKECSPENGHDSNSLPKAIGTRVSSVQEKTKVDSGTSESYVSSEVGVHGTHEKCAAKNVDVEKTVAGIDSGQKSLKGQSKEEGICSSQGDHIPNTVQLMQIEDKNKLKMDLPETLSQPSTTACSKMPSGLVNNEHGESVCKKLKTGHDTFYSCGSSRGRDSISEGFAAPRDELVCPLIEDKLCNAGCDEKIIHEDLGARERHFFPVDSRNTGGFHSGQKGMLWKGLQTENEEQCQYEVPNLELALGAELKTPNKGALPFLVGVVDKKNNQDKLPDRMNDEQAEDGEATSLSLSLSFPSPDKEQTLKRVSKSEQLLPEKHHVNSSMLLFGGLLDK